MSTPASALPPATPAEQLVGRTIGDGWLVKEKLDIKKDSTGGYFSTCYLAEKNGQTAFVKALDYWRAFGSGGNPAEILQAMTEAYNFECEILRKCTAGNFDRVVKALEFGTEYINKADPFTVVQFVIFELAQRDVRAHLKVSKQLDLAWALRTLHHVATGLKQLHGADIAHQDLKPSNVLVFREGARKIGDLGRAAYRGSAGPHDNLDVAGHSDYAPPELLYAHTSQNWDCRRFGCDLYLLGSLLAFFFAGNGITQIMLSYVPEPLRPGKFAGSYEDVLPHLRVAFDRTIEDVRREIPADIQNSLVPALRQLCDPDPNLRGDPASRALPGNQYSLERYLSLFDLTAHKAAIGVRTALS